MVVSVSGPSPQEKKSHDPEDDRSHDSLEFPGLAGDNQCALLRVLARLLGRNVKGDAGHLTRAGQPGRGGMAVCYQSLPHPHKTSYGASKNT